MSEAVGRGDDEGVERVTGVELDGIETFGGTVAGSRGRKSGLQGVVGERLHGVHLQLGLGGGG